MLSLQMALDAGIKPLPEGAIKPCEEASMGEAKSRLTLGHYKEQDAEDSFNIVVDHLMGYMVRGEWG